MTMLKHYCLGDPTAVITMGENTMEVFLDGRQSSHVRWLRNEHRRCLIRTEYIACRNRASPPTTDPEQPTGA